MKIKKRLTTLLLAFAMIMSFIPGVSVQAATNDIKIISTTKVTAKDAAKWAKSKGATQEFINLAELYWEYSPQCGGVNPGIAYVQSAKETGYGRFGGVIDATYHNPCGLKIAQGGDNYDPNAHQRFDSWDKGVQAHLDHLALYAGADGYPRSNTNDPRHFRTIKGKSTTVNGLGGNWAPSATYGEEVNNLYNDLLSYAGVQDKSTDDKNTNNDKNTSNNDDKDTSSGQAPNPGTPETKPGIPNTKEELTNIKSEIDNDRYSTVNITSTIGWKNEDGNWYYYKSDNTKAKGWIKPDDNWYYLKTDGKMATGWFKDNDQWYYFNESGTMARGWIQLNNSWYYLKNSGAMITGLNKIDNKNYLFNDSGAMATGWANINNYWYHFDKNGSMESGWILDNGTNYYLYDTGAMAKGWINLNGAWYYLNDSGAMMTGWVSSSNDWYYMDPSTGRMITNSTIDGYRIGSDGKGKKISSSSDTSNNNQPTTPGDSNSNNNTSSRNKTIVIDPGHNYGGDYGAETTLDGVTYSETVLNMQVASKLKVALENKGYKVVMTRTEDQRETLGVGQSLANRVNAANNINADFFVSIHHNSATAAAKGVETYYSSNPQDAAYAGNAVSNKLAVSTKLATAINNKIANKLSLNNRGGKDGNLFVCRNTNMPAVLVEVGFITNAEEAKRCANPQSQQLVAEAIAEAISENI